MDLQSVQMCQQKDQASKIGVSFTSFFPPEWLKHKKKNLVVFCFFLEAAEEGIQKFRLMSSGAGLLFSI